MLGRLRRENPARAAADRLHAAIAERARAAIFYTAFAVPDTVDGRFDLLTLHAFVVLDALKGKGQQADDVATQLATALFGGFEDALRDLGVTDFGLSRRIKAMANAFYGRLETYAVADDTALAAAIVRNLYRGDDGQAKRAAVLAHYATAARASTAASAVTDGAVDFGPLPEFTS